MFVESTLSKGEEIKVVCGTHKIIFLAPILMIILGLAIVGANTKNMQNAQTSSVESPPVNGSPSQKPSSAKEPSPFGVLFLLFVAIPFFISRVIYYISVEQILTNKRVFFKEGLLLRKTREINLNALESTSVDQSILGRMLNYGHLDFTGSGNMRVRFKLIPDPIKAKRSFEDQLEESK